MYASETHKNQCIHNDGYASEDDKCHLFVMIISDYNEFEYILDSISDYNELEYMLDSNLFKRCIKIISR